MQITEQHVRKQEQYALKTQFFSFDKNREPGTDFFNLVDRVEIEPASMVPQPLGSQPFAGTIRLFFMPYATETDRDTIKTAFLNAVPGEITIRPEDGGLVLNPEIGLVTPEAVEKTLEALYKTKAVFYSDIARALEAFDLEHSRILPVSIVRSDILAVGR
jgi:hypothetical protein